MTWLPWFPWFEAYTWGLNSAAVTQSLFVVVLATSTWWSWRAGRALFLKSAILAVMLDLTAITLHFEWAHLLEVATVLMWCMEAAILYLLWSIVEQKIHDRRNRRGR